MDNSIVYLYSGVQFPYIPLPLAHLQKLPHWMSEEHLFPEQLQQNPSVGYRIAPVVTVAAKIADTTKPLTKEILVKNLMFIAS